MKIIQRVTNKSVSFVIAAAFLLSITIEDLVHADVFDKLREDTMVASPGYLNAAKLRTDYILKQSTPKEKSVVEQVVDYVRGSFANKLAVAAEDQGEQPVNLQKKKGPDESTDSTAASSAITASIADLLDEEVAERAYDEAYKETSSTVTNLENGNIVSTYSEGGESYFKIININNSYISTSAYRVLADGTYNNYSVGGVTDIGNGQFAVTVRSYSSNESYGWRTYVTRTSVRIYDTSSGQAHELTDMRRSFSSYSVYNSDYRYSYHLGTTVSNITSLGDGKFAMGVNENYYSRFGDYSFGNNRSFIAVTSNNLNIYSGYRYNLSNNYSYSTPLQSNYSYNNQYVNKIISLGGGEFAVAASVSSYDASRQYSSGTNIMVLSAGDTGISLKNSSYFGNTYTYNAQTHDYSSSSQYVSQMASLGNGTFAIGWNKYSYSRVGGSYSNTSSISINTYGIVQNDLKETQSYSLGTLTTSAYAGSTYTYRYSYLSDMKVLTDGNIVAGINTSSYSYDYASRITTRTADASLKILGADGKAIDIALGGTTDQQSTRSISHITTMADGKFGVVMRNISTVNGAAVLKTNVAQFSSDGRILLAQKNDTSTAKQPLLDGTQKSGNKGINSSDKTTDIAKKDASQKSKIDAFEKSKNDSGKNINASVDASLTQAIAMDSEDLLAELTKSLTENNTLSAYSVFTAYGDIDALTTLKGILKNPTETQKQIIDTVTALMADLKDVENAKGSGLADAKSQLVESAAAALLAQALPNLLTSGDIDSIKNLFSKFDKAKGGLMSQYQSSMKAYYDEVKKDLADNISALQLNNLLSNNISDKELDNMPPSEIEKLMEKLRKAERKTAEIQQVLQHELKYREQYLKPGEKAFENLFKDFTEKLNTVLENSAIEKKTDKE